MAEDRQEGRSAAGRGRSRARFIQAASELLRRQGYNATGVKDIARQACAPMGSFYFHFPGGKEELAAVAMSYGAEEFRAVLAHALRSSDDLASCYARTATLIAERLAERDWCWGCPVATTALETAHSSPTLRACALSAFNTWRCDLAERAEQAGIAPLQAQVLATNALALLEGAELLARVQQSPDPLTHAAAALHTLARAAVTGLRS